MIETAHSISKIGRVLKWLKRLVLKTKRSRDWRVGSNPTSSVRGCGVIGSISVSKTAGLGSNPSSPALKTHTANLFVIDC